MKRSRIIDRKYKGYLIKPNLTGFDVFRNGYYIGQYPSIQVVKKLIDKVVSNSSDDKKTEKERQPQNPTDSAQLSLF